MRRKPQRGAGEGSPGQHWIASGSETWFIQGKLEKGILQDDGGFAEITPAQRGRLRSDQVKGIPLSFWRFIEPGTDLSQAVVGDYRLGLVALSIAIAIGAAISSLEVTERIERSMHSRARHVWLILGAICLGSGVWTMHFVGMIGFVLPVPVQYALGITLVSIVPAIVASAIALYFLVYKRASNMGLLVSACLIATGIGTMHYVGMEAMSAHGLRMAYDPVLFTLSLMVALLLAAGALLFKCRLSPKLGLPRVPVNLLSGAILGLAVSGMHYTAMAATRYLPDANAPFIAIHVSNINIGIAVAVTAAIVASAVLMSVMIDRRLKKIGMRPELFVMPALMLLTLLVLYYGTFSFVTYLEKDTKQRARLALETVLTTTKQALNSWHEQHLASAYIWAESEIIRSSTLELLTIEPNRESLGSSPAQQRLRQWFPGIGVWTRYRGYFIMDRDGISLASSRDANLATRNLLVSQREFMDEIWQGNAAISLPMVSDVPLRSENGELEAGYPTMFVGAPIRNQEGDIVAAFTFRIDPMADFVSLLERGRIGTSGETFAFDKSGLFLSTSRFRDQLIEIGMIAENQRAMLNVKLRNPGANLVAGEMNLIPEERQPLTRMAQSATNGVSGFNVDGYLDYRGVPVVGTWYWDSRTGMGIASEQDLEEAFAGFNAGRAAIIALAAFTTIIVISLAVFWILTRARQIETQQRTTEILETTHDGIITWNEEGYVESVNPACETIFGLKQGEMISRPLETWLPALEGQSYQDVRAFFRMPDGEALHFHMDSVGRRKDGETFPLDISVSESIMPSGDRLFTGILRDITERKKAEEELMRADIEKRALAYDLNVARDIQMSMLPLQFPPYPDRDEVDIYAILKPARAVGGDFYDFFELSDDRLCFCIGDVSGKGVPSALFMSMARMLIKARASSDHSPASIITHVNRDLFKNNTANMFVTLFLCVVDTKSGKVVYTNAGHCPPYLMYDTGGVERIDSRHGPIAGAVDHIEYSEDTLVLAQGDTLFMYTDGVTEAMNSKQQLFGEERLKDVLESLRFESATNVVETVADQVRLFEEESDKQADDITAMAVRHVHEGEIATVFVLELTVENRVEEIERVNGEFNQFCSTKQVDESLMQRFNVVFDELLSNIIYYGSEEGESSIIRIRVELLADRIKVAIASFGVPFDPWASDSPDTSQPIEERQAGGLGIHLVRNLMDEMTYYRRINQNVINLLKYRNQLENQVHTD